MTVELYEGLVGRFRAAIAELRHSPTALARRALVDEQALDPWFKPAHTWSERWVMAMALGPWQLSRSRSVGAEVVGRLHRRKLEELSAAEVDALGFPLPRQARQTRSLVAFLQRQQTTMRILCGKLRSGSGLEARGVLRAAVGVLYGDIRGIDYFVREALGLEAFPLDRGVRSFLAKRKLPASQEPLIRLCHAVAKDPRLVARAIFLHCNVN